MEIKEISNGYVDMVEYGHMEVIIEHDGEEYTLEFDTEEKPSDGYFDSVVFATDESEEIANEIGFVIDDDSSAELYHLWNIYSNENFGR